MVALVLYQEIYFCLGLPWNNSTVCVFMYSWLSDDYTGPIYFIHSRKLQGLIVSTLILMDYEEPFKKLCIHYIRALCSHKTAVGLTVKGLYCTEYQSFCTVVWTGSPPSTSSQASECVSPHPTWALGGDTLSCGAGSGGTQFRRLDRNSGTLKKE